MNPGGGRIALTDITDPPASSPPPGPVARLGLALRAHPRLITALQLLMVVFYVTLLVWPVLLPLPGDDDRILGHPARFAQFLFWGLWWPGVIVAVMLLGRFWCGVLCPEGALSEWVSRVGLGKGVPRWMRWPWWPFIAFLTTTVYGQLISVYEYPRAALLILGGSTVAAMLTGLLYGRGKRVWCRHLCPVSGVFAILARLSALHFRVDRAVWDAAPPGQRSRKDVRVNCAPMIDIRRMDSAAACHACGRCAGQRDAVQLAVRLPGTEISRGDGPAVRPGEAPLLLYGLLGVAIGAFRWSSSPAFVNLKQTAAGWLAAREWWWALDTDAPWWLLTHYPEANDVFSWLDGVLIVIYIGGIGLILGGILQGLCLLAARLGGGRIGYREVALAYAPLAVVGLLLGLSMTTLSLLRAEGVAMTWVDPVRACSLLVGGVWSAWLAWRRTQPVGGGVRRLAAWLLLCLGVLLVMASWGWVFRDIRLVEWPA